MDWLKFVFALLALVAWASSQKRGVQLRLTKKGMFYAVDVGIKIMQEDLKKDVINTRGKSGNLEYNVQNMRITTAVFQKYELIPVSGTGMRGQVSGITLEANGRLWYKYKKGWFKFSDTIGIDLKAENIRFDMTLNIGSDSNGRPTISIEKCSAGVSDIDIHFRGGKSWLYNLFRKIVGRKLKKSFGDLLCKMATKEINTKAKSELATFPVVKKIDKWAEIDYRLTKAPAFTSEYMDAYLKGEFKSVKDPTETQSVIPTFSTSSDHNRMIYFWITDYTLNSAGEVYNKTGRLDESFAAWDEKVPQALKSMLNTGKFALLFPKLQSLYPNAPMSLELKSYKPPTFEIAKDQLKLRIHAYAQFNVKDKSNKIIQVFTARFDITGTGSIGIQGDNISGKISSFDYAAKVLSSNVGKITIPLDSPLVKIILDSTVIGKANPILKKGFPLPKVNEIAFTNFDVKLEKNVIRIGTDIKYVKGKK
ncbi:lipopolysaccharide-binding protein-like [Hydractinia symbiolongicarpus]|uniref:lipopolysaccharide-binding protein-like n=1 Tax=Hydractinia symbiolongicarpus TaxID=13093 RepID=UPI0025508A9C|nr:lipopolysaccharide-binding protein-like [Hydractinia symbiolongicarpus]